jgi:type I restriction enzyme S subunit
MTYRDQIKFSDIFVFKNGKKRPKNNGKYNVYGSSGLIGTSSVKNTEGSISVIGRVGSKCGNVFFIKEPSYVSDNAIIAKTKKEYDSRYGYYLLKSKKLNRLSHGSGQPLINQDILNSLDTPLLTRQEEIFCAETLSQLDQKIELNQKKNETLEEIGKTLFKSWFINFDPVRAKAEGKPTGLSKEISDLFPDSFEDSELGEIPKGWKNIKLGDIAKVSSGKRPPEKEEIKSNTCPYVVFGGAGPIGFCSNSLEFNKPAIITGRVGTLGKVFFLDQECWVSDNSILICDAESYTPIIFQTLKHTNLSSLNVGSTQPLVTGRDIKNINIVGPDKSVLDAYVSLFNNFKIRQNKIIEENEVLLKLRDILLPRLISGELLISDAENLIEEANA